MKILITALALTQTVFAQTKEPEKLETLNKRYKEAVRRAVKPINEQYEVALLRIQKEYTQAGDLMAALAVKKQYDAVVAARKTGVEIKSNQVTKSDKVDPIKATSSSRSEDDILLDILESFNFEHTSGSVVEFKDRAP